MIRLSLSLTYALTLVAALGCEEKSDTHSHGGEEHSHDGEEAHDHDKAHHHDKGAAIPPTKEVPVPGSGGAGAQQDEGKDEGAKPAADKEGKKGHDHDHDRGHDHDHGSGPHEH